MQDSIKGGGKWQEAIVARLGTDGSNTLKARVGILEDATNNGKSVAEYAAYNEYGADINVTPKMRGYLAAVKGVHLKKVTNALHIPARPFMRTTFASQNAKWRRNIAALLAQKHTAIETLELVSSVAEADVQATIMSNMSPLNVWSKAPHGLNATKSEITGTSNAGGGENHTLIDTGTMLKSVTHEVVRE